MSADTVWFCVPERGALMVSERAKIRWMLARFADDGIRGPYDSAEAAEAELDDRRGVCSRCAHGRGRHVCAECQAAILPAVLCASVAVGGGR